MYTDHGLRSVCMVYVRHIYGAFVTYIWRVCDVYMVRL